MTPSDLLGKGNSEEVERSDPIQNSCGSSPHTHARRPPVSSATFIHNDETRRFHRIPDRLRTSLSEYSHSPSPCDVVDERPRTTPPRPGPWVRSLPLDHRGTPREFPSLTTSSALCGANEKHERAAQRGLNEFQRHAYCISRFPVLPRSPIILMLAVSSTVISSPNVMFAC